MQDGDPLLAAFARPTGVLATPEVGRRELDPGLKAHPVSKQILIAEKEHNSAFNLNPGWLF